MSTLTRKTPWTLAQSSALEDAVRTGYLVCKGGRPFVRPEYHAWCLRNERPFAWVYKRRRYAEVHLDMDPSYRHFTDEGLEQARLLFRSIPGIARGASAALGSWITFHRVPIVEAENTLVRLLAMAKDPAMTKNAFGGPGQFPTNGSV